MQMDAIYNILQCFEVPSPSRMIKTWEMLTHLTVFFLLRSLIDRCNFFACYKSQESISMALNGNTWRPFGF